jgi:hypothetical protein
MCKMVKGAMVLMRVWIGTLYKLLGNVDSTRCNNIVVPEVDSTSTPINSNQDESIQTNLRSPHQNELTMLWHERIGHIGEK